MAVLKAALRFSTPNSHRSLPTTFSINHIISKPTSSTHSLLRMLSKMHSTASNPNLSRLAARLPAGTWDTHMHVVDPITFPLDKAAQYQPNPHTMIDAKVFLSDQLGIQNMVIVQPSIYGNDNACTLDGLKHLGPERGRAVIQFDPATTSQKQLKEWHDLGVRGVRLNFKSVGVTPTAEDLSATLKAYATAMPAGWVLELYIALESIPLLEEALKEIDVDEKNLKICIDHFGHPSAESLKTAKKASDVSGFNALLRLLEKGHTWVKISASYRLSKDPKDPLVKSLCREIVRKRPDRCVFATDWPHTRFDGIEVGMYLEKILDWCEDEGADLKQILATNAEELFDVR